MTEIYCPNCVPDYLNGYIDHPPVVLDGHGCSKCGLGWDRRDRQQAIDMVANMRNRHLDHVADWLAMFLADAGPQAIVNARELALKWSSLKDDRAGDNLKHIVALACMARYCVLHDKGWQMCQDELKEMI